MSAGLVTSVVASLIALAALFLTVQQLRMARAHNKLSVRPVLDFGLSFAPDKRAGLRLRNVGLGPAEVVSGRLLLDGELKSDFSGNSAKILIRDELAEYEERLHTALFDPGAFLAKDYDAFVVSIDSYQPDQDASFADFISRLAIDVTYASLYGDRTTIKWQGA